MFYYALINKKNKTLGEWKGINKPISEDEDYIKDLIK
jgi:hypothetical protein